VDRHQKISTLSYLLMGWMGLIALRKLLLAVPVAAVYWLISGGVLFSVGVVFYVWRRLPHNHAIWHLFVLGGTFCHYVAVLRYLVPLVR
jgi:hemolysin III